MTAQGLVQDRYAVTLTFIEELLGATPKNRKIWAGNIGDKADITEEQYDEELSTVPDNGNGDNKGWTGFHVDEEGNFFLYDYVIKGFFKDACSMLRRSSSTLSSKLSAHKKIVDGLVMIVPRRLTLHLPPGGEMGTLERPLRAQTAQGERVAIAKSDTFPPGSQVSFEIAVLGKVAEKQLREWLDYGYWRGLCQWRNGGYGRFTYEMEALQA
jgi:hypothetical protein